MGLDITAFRSVRFVRTRKDDNDYGEDKRLVFLYPSCADFAKHCDGLAEGLYETSDIKHGFRAGSYGGYNAWRAQLARLVGTTPDAVWNGHTPPAFGELIGNSDCEGFIGPKTSAKLAKDFADWQERADTFDCAEAEWFRAKYADWRKAFELAAGEGVVELH